MRHRNHIAAAVVAAAAALAAPWPLVAQESEDPVVAVVDGEEIRRSTVEEVRGSLPQLQQVPLEMVYEQLLDHVIISHLLTSKAREAGLADDPEVQQRLKMLEEQILQQAYLAERVDDAMTDERLRAAYDEYVESNPPQEQVRARHILLDSEEAAREAIAAIEGGAAFEEVARERSTGPTAENGGDLGYFSREDMVEPFAEAAFGMEAGEVSAEPVQTQFGWHVIKVEDRRMSEPPAFAEMRDELRRNLAEQVAQEEVARLREEADIDRFALDGTPLENGAGAGAAE